MGDGGGEALANGRVTLYAGDCRDVLATLAENSIDAACVDPPYHLQSIVKRFGAPNAAPAQFGNDGAFARASAGFMGKVWDGGDVAFRPETWAAVYRVLKPGGYLVAFGGSRTYHRLACAIEDAGFIIHPLLGWIFGQGFPKAHSVSKHIDRTAGAEREIVGRKTGRYATPVQDIRGGSYAGGNGKNGAMDCSAITAPATDAAKQWDGWFYGGQTLKPALEPICFAQKPFEKWLNGTQNVLKWGTGGLNIDACRISTSSDDKEAMKRVVGFNKSYSSGEPSLSLCGGIDGSLHKRDRSEFDATKGRWPANVAHDGSEDVLAEFPETETNSTGVGGQLRGIGYGGGADGLANESRQGDSGSAARFFYEAKPDDEEPKGRWPANVAHDGSEEVRAEFPDARSAGDYPSDSVGTGYGVTYMPTKKQGQLYDDSGSAARFFYEAKPDDEPKGRWPANVATDGSEDVLAEFPDGSSSGHHAQKSTGFDETREYHGPGRRSGDSGSAARFWYCSKADSNDRLGSKHPTVKPVDLIQWLCRMITPPGGVILDCFAGTGTTGEAAIREGFRAVLIEAESEYCADIRRRMQLATAGPDERRRESIKASGKVESPGPLFDGLI